MRGRLVRRRWTHDPAAYAPPRHRRACAYETFEPDPLVGDGFPMRASAVAAVSEAERSIAALNASARPELAPFARLLLRTESIASSTIEGLVVDLRDLIREEAADRASSPRVAEILATIAAMTHAVDSAAGARRLDVATVCGIHGVLMQGAAPTTSAGRLRTVQNWIGGNDYTPCGAEFTPPAPERVETLLADLCAFADTEVVSPLAQAAIAHAQFETIHPFVDGNGRTGRALVHVILRRRGLAPHVVTPLSVSISRGRERYVAGLTAFREGRVDDWVESFAAAASEGAAHANRYLSRLDDLQATWREALGPRAPRADAAVWDVLRMLPSTPVASVPALVQATGRSRPAVNDAVAVLDAAGVLVPLGVALRNRRWEPAGLLDLMDEMA